MRATRLDDGLLRQERAHKRPTVRESVFGFLRSSGITRIFGNPGSTELPLLCGMPDDFDYVLGLQESVVVGMADGFAQASHNAAVVNLHSAAGVGHAMGNIFTAFKNHTPLVIIAGQQARSLLPFDPFLFSNQATELPKPYVKWSCEPARPEDVPKAIARAYWTAMQEPRGPVLVSVPVDDWDVPTDYVPAHQVGHHVQPDTKLLGQLADALARCASPAFVVGAEVDRSRAWAPMVQLAEKFGARVFAAPMIGRSSFPEDHALFAGFLRPRMEHVRECLESHDLVFAIGAPIFTYNVQGTAAPMLEGSKVFQLVEDPNVAAWTPVGTSIVGNIRVGVEYLLGQAGPGSRPWPAAKPPVPRVTPSNGDARPSVACVMQALADARHRSDIIVEEAPSARGDMQAHLPIYETGTYYTMCSGGLGYGLPAAVGIALAQPDRRVIAVIGDGSCMYSVQALWSAVELGLSMTIVILQNGRYAAMQNMSKALGFAATTAIPGIELPHLDFVQLANGQGCQACSVSNARELPAAVARALRSKGPFLLSVEVE